MYLLYLDGSGSVRNPAERHFILAGVAVFERQIYHLINDVETFVDELGLGPGQDVELHALVGNHNKLCRNFFSEFQILQSLHDCIESIPRENVIAS